MSDRCTLFPDGNYSECCIEHDNAYTKGGTKEERLAADKALFRCIVDNSSKSLISKAGYVAIASVVYVGVRIFGGLFFGKP